jgi:hypothetical protein
MTAWNSGGTILDAVESTRLSEEDHQAVKVANSQALKLLAITQGSANKERAEVAATPKQSTVTIDPNVVVETIQDDSEDEAEEATSPLKTPRQDLISRMARAAETLREDGFTPEPLTTPGPTHKVPKKTVFGPPPPPPPAPSANASGALNSEVSTLLRGLIQRFDSMATTQESVLKTQDLLARTIAKQETARENSDAAVPKREPLIAPSTTRRKKKTRYHAKGRQTGIFTQ